MEEQRPVVDSHDVVWLHAHDKVEIFDGTVVITHLHAQDATVVMCEEIIRIDFNSHVIIRHSAAKVVDIEPCQCPVDIATRHLRLEVNHLSKLLVRLLPFLP